MPPSYAGQVLLPVFPLRCEKWEIWEGLWWI